MLMMNEAMLMGAESGPISPLQYKRAVMRPAPREFTVEVLEPTKQGSHYAYGLKVCPVFSSKGSSDSRSTSSLSEYEIWRRWEDCLDFQETLESEYSKMSRQKVKVLKRAATAKMKNDNSAGPYNLRNAAASFESLPDGPDPREVQVDVHKLIPQLTRKGALFRVGRSTVKQRGDEFTAMIKALFDASPDAPVLLQVLRDCSLVREFFAIWRRDHDFAKKSGKDVSRLRHSNHSMSSLSNFSFSNYSPPSSPGYSPAPSMISQATRSRHSMFSRGCTDRLGDDMPPAPVSAPPGNRGFIPGATPTLTRSNTFQERRPAVAIGASSGSIMFTDELLLADEPATAIQSTSRHPTQPQQIPYHYHYHSASREDERPTSHSSSIRPPYPIPEEELRQLPRPQPRPRSNSATTPGYRNARIFVTSPSSALGIEEQSSHRSNMQSLPHAGPSSPSPTSSSRYAAYVSSSSSQSSSLASSVTYAPSSSTTTNRLSFASSHSSYTQASKRSSGHDSDLSHISDHLDGTLFISPTITHTPLSEIAEGHFEPGHHSRDSASSFASLRTEASADGVLPRHLRPHVNSPRDVGSPFDRRNHSPIEESISEGGEDLIDAYFTDLGDGATFSMETLDKELPSFLGHKGKHSISSISSQGSIGSINSATEYQTMWSPRDDALVIKAIYNECVIVFRAERKMSLTIIRERIKERFALHECVPLDDGFVLGYIPSRTTTNDRIGRSNSVNSMTPDISRLRLLQTETDWQTAMVTSNGKITLRVLDPELHM